MLKIMHVVGARPNFPKVAPIMTEMSKRPDRYCQVLVHTGQHYDYSMSGVFFEHLEMPNPDVFLNAGSGSHAVQVARVMTAFESVVLEHSPDWVIVVGDVNSTLACALVCSKLGIRVAHVEAGLRSRDRTMPEEINRLLTDQLSDLLLTSSRDANDNLVREGIDPSKIRFVGNVMIDTLVKMLPKALERPILGQYGLRPEEHLLVTLHRPSNVDDPLVLSEILQALIAISREKHVLFPVHPRTCSHIHQMGIEMPKARLQLVEPLGYLDFLALMNSAALVITDSGGVQEETTYLGVPCLTVRQNTERPITVTQGTNRLVDCGREALLNAASAALQTPRQPIQRLELWDGRAACRIVDCFDTL